MQKLFILMAAFFALAMFSPSAHAQTLSCPSGANHCASISWTAGAVTGNNAATGFNVYRSTTSGACSTVSASGCTKVGSTTTATTFVDSPLAATTTYFWVVTATNAAGESGPSNQVSATTGQDPLTVPAAPTGVTVTAK